jgi:hypothetical protein
MREEGLLVLPLQVLKTARHLLLCVLLESVGNATLFVGPASANIDDWFLRWNHA